METKIEQNLDSLKLMIEDAQSYLSSYFSSVRAQLDLYYDKTKELNQDNINNIKELIRKCEQECLNNKPSEDIISRVKHKLTEISSMKSAKYKEKAIFKEKNIVESQLLSNESYLVMLFQTPEKSTIIILEEGLMPYHIGILKAMLFDKYHKEVLGDHHNLIRDFLTNTNNDKINLKLKSILDKIDINKPINYIPKNSTNNMNGTEDSGLNNCLKELDLTDLEIFKLNKFFLLDYTNLEALKLVNNKIKELEMGCFVSQKILVKLDLSRNQIVKLKEKRLLFFKVPIPLIFDRDISCFFGLKSLKQLNLTSNQINKIEKDTFSDMPSLEVLNLSSNKIRRLEKGCFNDLTQLKSLDLSSNMIIELRKNSFIGLDNLEILNLSKNGMEILKTGCFNGLNKLKELNLTDNNAKKAEKHSMTGLSNRENIKLLI